MKSGRLVVAALALLFGAAGESGADYISGVTASTDMGSGFGTDIQNTVNGVGLSSPALNATHDGSSPLNSWVSSGGVLTGSVTFYLPGIYNVNGFSFWNQNGGGPGFMGITGVQNVQVLYSLDGEHFSPLPGGPSVFAQVPGDSNLPPQTFTFPTVKAIDFQFNVLSNYGDTGETGFAEVAFNGTQVTTPEPSALAHLGSALCAGLGYFGWRRRKPIPLSSAL